MTYGIVYMDRRQAEHGSIYGAFRFTTAAAAHEWVDRQDDDARASLVARGYRVVRLAECCPAGEPEPCRACAR